MKQLKFNDMIQRLLTSLLLVAGLSMQAQVHRYAYKNPTEGEFPILAWFSILPESNLTPERYEEMRNAGFNISFSHFSTAEQLEKGLQACRGTGVKIMATCKELEKETAETVNRFKNDPMLAGWFLRDEPTVHGFAELREFRDRVYAADTTHTVYLNLLPSIVNPKDLGTKDYEEYAQRFVDEVALPQISYDFYPIVDEGGKIHVRPQFYENLEVVRKVALRNGMPFWAFVLSTAHDPYPLPTATHMRLEAFSALAYGAQCIQYFTYWTPIGTVWNFHNAPIAKDGRRTHVYYLIKDLNREIQNLAPVFLGAEAAGVWHTGSIPQGTTQLQTLPAPFTRVEADGQGVLVSHLVNGKRQYLMIVNRDIDNAQNVTIEHSRTVKRIMPDGTERKEKTNGACTMPLAPGDYLLYRFE